MSRIQSKSMKHIKNQDSLGKRQSRDANIEMTQMFNYQTKTWWSYCKKSYINGMIGCLSQKTEYIKKKHLKLSELSHHPAPAPGRLSCPGHWDAQRAEWAHADRVFLHGTFCCHHSNTLSEEHSPPQARSIAGNRDLSYHQVTPLYPLFLNTEEKITMG